MPPRWTLSFVVQLLTKIQLLDDKIFLDAPVEVLKSCREFQLNATHYANTLARQSSRSRSEGAAVAEALKAGVIPKAECKSVEAEKAECKSSEKASESEKAAESSAPSGH